MRYSMYSVFYCDIVGVFIISLHYYHTHFIISYYIISLFLAFIVVYVTICYIYNKWVISNRQLYYVNNVLYCVSFTPSMNRIITNNNTIKMGYRHKVIAGVKPGKNEKEFEKLTEGWFDDDKTYVKNGLVFYQTEGFDLKYWSDDNEKKIEELLESDEDQFWVWMGEEGETEITIGDWFNHCYSVRDLELY